MSDLIFVQFLLESERDAIERLHDAARGSTIATGSSAARSTLLQRRIPHHFEPFDAPSWQSVNTRLHRCLMSNPPTLGMKAPGHLDTWSHFLVSQVNHLYPLAVSIVKSCRRFPPMRLFIRHALSVEDYATLVTALSGLDFEHVEDWDRHRGP